MPVHKVAGGWQWGRHGHVYPTRAGAERQARAIYASGYRDAIFDRVVPRAAITAWAAAKRAETQYAVSLRKIARAIGDLVHGYRPDDPQKAALAADAIERYADLITPWAEARAGAMVAEIAARNDKQWRAVSAQMGQNFEALFANQDIGARLRQLQAEQVELIRSIPLEAAQRVHELAMRGVIEGERFTTIVPEIMRQGEVSRAKATLIARTETGRVVSNLVQARSEAVDSTEYVWRTMRDAQVRPSHRQMEGRVVRWDSPPTLDKLTGHAGALPNCRCYSEPIIPQ